jgi:hypothetical protein
MNLIKTDKSGNLNKLKKLIKILKKMNYMDAQKDRYLNEELGEYKDKIKLRGTKEEYVKGSSESKQNFNLFKYAPNGDFNNYSIRILVPATSSESHMVRDLKWSIEQYNKLTPSYKAQIKEIIIPKLRKPGTGGGFFLYDKPNTIYIFEDVIERSKYAPHFFFHEGTHSVDYAGGVFIFSDGEFKNLLYSHAKNKLSHTMYINFKRVTIRRDGFNQLTDSEKDRIKELFSSDYGYNSWRRYVERDSKFHGRAFSEEFADSVATIASGLKKDRSVSNNLKQYIMENVLI